MLISVIAPVYNEEKTIIEILKKVIAVKLDKEILVVDDGSTDKTPILLKKFVSEKNNIRIFTHPRNFGKGAAIQTALSHVKGEIIIIQDTDLEYDPVDYSHLIQPFVNGSAKVVYGSRILGKSKSASWVFYIGGRSLTALTNLLYGSSLTDEPTGYKVFAREVIKKIKLTHKGFSFCAEVTAKLLRQGYKIIEVPISYQPRPVNEKKISLPDWFFAVATLVWHRFAKV